MNIVLHEPEKPDNTGNIGRTCVASGSILHLIEPCGFIINEKNLKHAGLDYWERLEYYKYINFVDFIYKNNLENAVKIPKEMIEKSKFLIEGGKKSDAASAEMSGAVNDKTSGKVSGAPSGAVSGAKIYFATTKAHKTYADVKYNEGDYIMFGKESAGISEEILAENEDLCIRIPMAENERSLNLANSVAIVLYEALRQQGFKGLEEKGELHRLSYK